MTIQIQAIQQYFSVVLFVMLHRTALNTTLCSLPTLLANLDPLMVSYNRKLLFHIQVPPSPITVTIALDWNVKSVGKPIPAAYTTQVSYGTALVDIMNKAANENTTSPFNKYASTYHGGLGHSITTMNGIKHVCVSMICSRARTTSNTHNPYNETSILCSH